jgi:hypothetical protein
LQHDLAGKVALVTGGSRGIGAAVARALAGAGADVALTYLNSRQAAEIVAGELCAKGVRARSIRADQAAAEIPPPGPLPRLLLRMPNEPGRLLQDRLMQVTQLSARIDPQILLKDPAAAGRTRRGPPPAARRGKARPSAGPTAVHEKDHRPPRPQGYRR